MLFKAEPYELDIISKGDDFVVGGYSTWELRDPQNDIITTQAQVGFLKRLFALPPEYQNVTIKHGDFKIGTPLLKYVAKNGVEYFSHVNEKGTYLLSKIRNDNFKSTQLWRDKILNGELAMYSISGLPLQHEIIREGGEEIRKVLDLEPWAVTLCERGINPKAHTQIISKERLTEEQIREKLLQFYEKRDKYQKQLDQLYQARESIEADDLRRTLDVIYSEIHALEEALGITLSKKSRKLLKQDEKPPKDWWDACVASVEGADPAAVCGHIFFHVLGGDRSRADPSMFEKGYVWNIHKKETETKIEPTLKAEVEELLQKHGFNKTRRNE